MLPVILLTAHTAEPMDDPSTSPVDPMYPPPGRKNWKYYIRRWTPKPPNWIPKLSNKTFKPLYWISKPSVWVFIALVAVTGLSFIPLALSRLDDPVVLGATEDLNGTNYVGLTMQLVGGLRMVDIPQVVLFGDISNFNWGDAEKVSVQWSLWARGGYKRDPETPADYDLVDRAVDVYLNRWVQIRFFPYPRSLSDKCQCIATDLFVRPSTPANVCRPPERGCAVSFHRAWLLQISCDLPSQSRKSIFLQGGARHVHLRTSTQRPERLLLLLGFCFYHRKGYK